MANFVDFQDFHPYYGTATIPSATEPAPGDWRSYRGSPNYRPWLIGENGVPTTAGTTAQTNRWNALGTILSKAPDCLGIMGFCLSDYSNSGGDFGIYDATLANPRSQITIPFSSWITTRAIATDYSSTVLADGALGFWKLNETSNYTHR